MPKICYVEKRFQEKSMALIVKANAIVAEYQQQGFSLTLRQLYYQMVARAIIANEQREYKRLGGIVNDARLAGLIDWWAIEDRTRTLRGSSHWSSPKGILDGSVRGYALDKWLKQPHRVECWIEKDALIGVISGICQELDIDYFSCRGYVSASAMWRAAMRLAGYERCDQEPVILHLGDHDPSGMDMTRDIEDRLALLSRSTGILVERIALTREQIEEYKPPPNPAKLSDSRASAYVAEHGYDSWELDALEPMVLRDLIESHTLDYRDETLWDEACAVEREHIEVLEGYWDSAGEEVEPWKK